MNRTQNSKLAQSNGNLFKSVKEETLYDMINFKGMVTPKDTKRGNANSCIRGSDEFAKVLALNDSKMEEPSRNS